MKLCFFSRCKPVETRPKVIKALNRKIKEALVRASEAYKSENFAKATDEFQLALATVYNTKGFLIIYCQITFCIEMSILRSGSLEEIPEGFERLKFCVEDSKACDFPFFYLALAEYQIALKCCSSDILKSLMSCITSEGLTHYPTLVTTHSALTSLFPCLFCPHSLEEKARQLIEELRIPPLPGDNFVTYDIFAGR